MALKLEHGSQLISSCVYDADLKGTEAPSLSEVTLKADYLRLRELICTLNYVVETVTLLKTWRCRIAQ